MNKRTVSERYEIKEGGKWITTYYTEDQKRVYQSLARVTIAHYICKASYVKRITLQNNYDDTMTLRVYEDNGGRRTIIYER